MHAGTAALHLSWQGSREGECWLGDYVRGHNLNPVPKHSRLGGADLFYTFFRHPGLGSGGGEADDGLQSTHCDGQGEVLTVGPQL